MTETEMILMSSSGLSPRSHLTLSISWITSNPDVARPKMLSHRQLSYQRKEKKRRMRENVRMFVVQPSSLDGRDEELTPVGALTRIGHTEHVRSIMLKGLVELVLKVPAPE